MGRREADPNFPTRCLHCMAKGRDSYEDPITGKTIDRCRTCRFTEKGRAQYAEDALRGGIIRRF